MASTFTVERRGHINASPAAVADHLLDFRRWTAWSPWQDLDPNQQQDYGGADSGVGAWSTWKGNRKAGEGRMEITAADASSVTIDLRFVKPFKSENTVVFRLEPHESGTEVVWTMVGPKTFMTKVMGIFMSMDKMIGKDFEKGLASLKQVVESAGGDQS